MSAALSRICHESHGVLLCMDRATDEQPLDRRIAELGDHSSVEAQAAHRPLRDIGIGSQILRDLGLREIRLLSNNAKRLAGIEGYGLHVVEVLPLDVSKITVLPVKGLKVASGGA